MKTSLKQVHARKIVHTGSALLVVSIAALFGWQLFWILGPLFFVLLTLSRFYLPLKSLRDRKEDSIGELLFPLGVTLAAIFADTFLGFAIPVLILGISDTAAFYAGKYLKSPRIIFHKTVLGTTVFFMSSFIITLLTGNIGFSLVVAVGASFVELFSPHGTDNLSVPVLVGAALLFL